MKEEVIIADIKSTTWYLLAKRSKTPPLPVWNKFRLLSYETLEKLYGVRIPTLVSWEGRTGSFYLHSAPYAESVKKISSHLFSDIKKVKKHINQSLKFCSIARREAKQFYKKDLSGITEKELLAQYRRVVEAYGTAFLYGYVTWCTQLLQARAFSFLQDKKDSLALLGINENKAFEILIGSKQKTLYSKKETALDILAQKYKPRLANISRLDKEVIKEKLPGFHKAIVKFLQTYEWVGYDYGGPAISYEEVLNMLQKRNSRIVEMAPTKAKILSVCKFSASEKSLYDIFSLLIYIKDARNIADDYVHFCLDGFFAEIGKRHNLTKWQVRYLWPYELDQMVKHEQEFTSVYLEKKIAHAVVIFDNKVEKFFVGAEAKNQTDMIVGKRKLNTDNKELFKGTGASSGKVRGVVKVVESFDELNKVLEGDILVTSMTSPRFMAGIVRSSAIITDEGGLTCHAAIIARELHKPCIVGSKIATKVLKDGDMVEVDADKGIVIMLS